MHPPQRRPRAKGRERYVNDLEGKVALVTGASRGVGAAAAVALAEAGCDVACAARATEANPQRTSGTIDETVRRIEATGRRGLAVPTNLGVDDEVVAMVKTTHEHFGRLDILINNAAITFIGDLDIPLKRYDLIMQVNLRAPLIAIRVGTCPEQWPGTTQSPSRVDPPFYGDHSTRATSCRLRDRCLPHRHVGERHERHIEPPCRWHFRLVRVVRDRRDERIELPGHASRDAIADRRPGPATQVRPSH